MELKKTKPLYNKSVVIMNNILSRRNSTIYEKLEIHESQNLAKLWGGWPIKRNSCSSVPLSPGDGVAFVGVSDVLAAPRFLVVTFFAAVRVGFQAAVLTLPEFRW